MSKTITVTSDECLEMMIAIQSSIRNAEDSERYWADLAKKSGKDGFCEFPHAAGNAEYYHKSIETLKSLYKKVSPHE